VQLPLDLTMHLGRKSYIVEVICGSEQYAPLDEDPRQDPPKEGVTVIRFQGFSLSNRHVPKAIQQTWFNFAAKPRTVF
jgi:hypothetical protein